MKTTEQNEYVYAVYAMNGYEGMLELRFRTTDKIAARLFVASIDAIYDPCIVKFEFYEIVPEYMDVD